MLKDFSKKKYNLEQLWIQIEKLNVRKCIICLIHRPPSTVGSSIMELECSMNYQGDFQLHFIYTGRDTIWL